MSLKDLIQILKNSSVFKLDINASSSHLSGSAVDFGVRALGLPH